MPIDSSHHQPTQDDWLEDDAHSSAHPNYDPTAQREWSSLSEKFTNDGYREGIDPGKLSTLQSGFDQGYLLATPAARRLGKLRGQVASLLSLLAPPAVTAGKPRIPVLPLSDGERNELTEECRSLSKELSRLRMEDVVGRDHEAEEHAKTHDEDGTGEGEKEWEEGETKAMDDLEDLMSGMGGGQGEKKERELVRLDPLEARLASLKERVGRALAGST